VVTTTRSRVSEGIDGKDAVGLYLEGIAKTPLLSAEEEVELAKTIELGLYAEHILNGDVTLAERGKRAKRPTTEELEQLVAEGQAAMQRFVTANPLLDLVQEGNTGLIRAVEKFDYTKGFKFSTYGTWWVRQSISRGIAQQGRIVRLPVHVAEQVNQVGAVRRTLERRLGRDPEIDEIAAEMDLEPDRVLDLMRYGRDHVSLDAPVEEGGDTALGDLIAREPMPGPDEVFLDAEEHARLDAMLSQLDERSADVVRRRYGLIDGRQAKLADIGALWGITAERVRQIERHAIAKLRGKSVLAA
jgi:RNA polymerase sigma factor (sigma-70 family)